MGRILFSTCAVVVAALLLGAAPQPKTGANGEGGHQSQKIAESLERLATAQEKAVQPSEIEESCARGAENRHSDLCAQWKAADAANDAALWAMRGFWVSLATIGALALTIWQSHRGLAIAHASLGAQERPWIDVELSVSEYRKGESADGKQGFYVDVDICLVNRGRSPAHRHDVTVEVTHLQPEVGHFSKDRTISPRSALIFTERSWNSAVFIPAEFLTPLTPGLACPFIAGRVNYTSPYVPGVRQTSFVYGLGRRSSNGRICQINSPAASGPLIAILASSDAD